MQFSSRGQGKEDKPAAGWLTVMVEGVADLVQSTLSETAMGLVVVMFFTLSIFTTYLGADPDLFARLAVGKLIFASHEVTSIDPFAFTPKKTLWIDHEWLSGVVFYLVSTIHFAQILFGLKVLLAFLTIYIFLKAQSHLRGTNYPQFTWSLITTIPCAYIWMSTIRSQVFTYLFLAILLLSFVLYEKLQSKRVLLTVPLMMLFWSNAHGGFVVGLGLLGLFVITCAISKVADWRLPGLILALSSIAVLINPYPGFSYLTYIVEAVTMPRPNIDEWSPINPISADALWLNVIVLLIFIGALLDRQVIKLNSILMLLVTMFFAYRHNRLQALFFVTAAVYGEPYFSIAVNRFALLRPKFFKMLGRMFAIFILFATIAVYPRIVIFLLNYSKFKLDLSAFPVQACDFLAAEANLKPPLNNMPYRVLTEFNSGSYVLWRLFPNFQISVDGRYEELYPESTVELNNRALNGNGVEQQQALESINPDYILTTVPDYLSKISGFANSWKIVHQQSPFALIGKK